VALANYRERSRLDELVEFLNEYEMSLFAALDTGDYNDPALTMTGSSRICGTVGTNAVGSKSVKLAWSVEIRGDLLIGKDADPDEVIDSARDKEDVIVGVIANNSDVHEFPSVNFPEPE